MEDFISWIHDENDTLDEHSFMGLVQKPGDYVFFGIHLLNRLYNELQTFPFLSFGPQEGRTDISKHVAEILKIDIVRNTIIVQPERSPHSMGYRNKVVNKKDRRGQIHLPSRQLEDVTFLLPNESSAKKLWVVITNPYQRKLAASLRKKEIKKQKKPNLLSQFNQI